MTAFPLTTPRRHRGPVPAAAGVPDYVVDVSRPLVPWTWTEVLLAPVELLAVVWSVPFALLLVGIPIALLAALVLRAARLLFG